MKRQTEHKTDHQTPRQAENQMELRSGYQMKRLVEDQKGDKLTRQPENLLSR